MLDKGHVIEENDGLSGWTDEVYWAESAAFFFKVPELEVIAHIGMWNRPNVGVAAGGIAVWDGTGSDIYDCRYFDVDWTMKFPASADGTNATLPNGLRIERVAPLKEYHLTYENEECTADLTWTAVNQAHAFAAGQTAVAVGKGHFEQVGWAKGHITVRGERLDIDSYSLRDRSYGAPRNSLGFMPTGTSSFAIADDSTSFQLLLVDNAAPEPVIGGGFLTLDGVTADIIRGSRRVLDRKGSHVTRFVIDLADDLGRELSVECVNSSYLRWLFMPRQYVQWSLMKCTIAGRPAWGEDQDFFNGKDARKYLRG